MIYDYPYLEVYNQETLEIARFFVHFDSVFASTKVFQLSQYNPEKLS